jgi:valyl-tRNA synthetase
VVAGEVEAVVHPAAAADAAAAGRDRARREKELAETEGLLAAARARLADERFTAKAPPAVVEGARSREAELAERAAKLRARLAG